MAKKKTEKSEQKAGIPIEWHVPDTIITRFASNMVIQSFENVFKISFFEIKPEIHLTPPQIPQSTIRADCVASVIVTPDKFSQMVEVLQRQIKKPESDK
jgi:hypothetical protein